jgi:hypothetical protein
MRFRRFTIIGIALLGALAFGFFGGRAAAQRSASPKILGVYGVGGVIGDDGSLYQYMPDQRQWLTIDDAFRGEGRQTQILPLPVAATEIQFMESWGFLITREGEVWHYDLNANAWENVGAPAPASR